MPLFGSPDVEKLIEKRDIKRLAKVLADDDQAIRDRAVQGLIEIGDPTAVPFVVGEVRAHQQDAVIEAGVKVLRELGAVAVPTLVAGLQSGREDARAGYAALLGRMGAEYGLAPLIEKSRDPNPEMRAIAAMGLGLVAAPEAQSRLAEMVSGDDSIEGRSYAGFAMATHKVPGAYETLMGQLDSSDPASRALAATNLGLLGDLRATDRITQLAEQDPDSRVSDAARNALISLGG
jgi:HEAT repeat protein